MKPYMVIQGSSQAVEVFEDKVISALEMGYSLAGELVAQPHATEIKFFQPVLFEEDDDFEDDDEEEEDEDE